MVGVALPALVNQVLWRAQAAATGPARVTECSSGKLFSAITRRSTAETDGLAHAAAGESFVGFEHNFRVSLELFRRS